MITLEPGRVVGGHYHLERELARGSMGLLWVAFDRSLNRRVALKFMNPALIASPRARARFEREAMTTAQIESPHVVQIHEVRIEEDATYIVMELLEGEDLRRRLEARGHLPVDEVAAMLDQVAGALDIVHAKGIVHRDLKPGNLFFARLAGEEIIKLLDFGVAKAPWIDAVSELAEEGGLVGTVYYMSPEQSQGRQDVDYRSDLWSLGVVVYRAVTGALPFQGTSASEVLARVCAASVPPVAQGLPHLPIGLDRFFQRALAPAPAARFSSAREMASSFAALAHDDAPAGYDPAPSSSPQTGSKCATGAP